MGINVLFNGRESRFIAGPIWCDFSSLWCDPSLPPAFGAFWATTSWRNPAGTNGRNKCPHIKLELPCSDKLFPGNTHPTPGKVKGHARTYLELAHRIKVALLSLEYLEFRAALSRCRATPSVSQQSPEPSQDRVPPPSPSTASGVFSISTLAKHGELSRLASFSQR